jgi:hypothetical protein
VDVVDEAGEELFEPQPARIAAASTREKALRSSLITREL